MLCEGFLFTYFSNDLSVASYVSFLPEVTPDLTGHQRTAGLEKFFHSISRAPNLMQTFCFGAKLDVSVMHTGCLYIGCLCIWCLRLFLYPSYVF